MGNGRLGIKSEGTEGKKVKKMILYREWKTGNEGEGRDWCCEGKGKAREGKGRQGKRWCYWRNMRWLGKWGEIYR